MSKKNKSKKYLLNFTRKNKSEIYLNSINNLPQLLAGRKIGERIVIVTNTQLEKLYAKSLQISLEKTGKTIHLLVIPTGERYKNLRTVSYLLDKFIEFNLERNDTIIALGGGVVGDITGFASSIYLRGINFIQIPTSLLAMVDSAIGGKTGVDHQKGKNLIGSFYQPILTLIDPNFLQTLPKREIRCGLAEIVKYALIQDKKLFTYLEKKADKIYKNRQYTSNLQIWQYLIKSSVKNKTEIVLKDEREAGIRAFLNLGHTIGHAIEASFGYKTYLHGEAVAIGIKFAFLIALKQKLITQDYFNKVIFLLQNLGFNLKLKPINREKFINAIFLDKKVKNKNLVFVLPIGNSEVELTNQISLDLVDSLSIFM